MNWLGWLSTLCFALCYFPQLLRTYRSRNVHGVSTVYWAIVVIGYVTGLLYVRPLKDVVLLLTYSIGLVCAVAMLVGCLWFRRRSSSSAS